MNLRIATVLLALGLTAPAAFPADPPPQAALEIRVVELKHLKGEPLNSLVRNLQFVQGADQARYDSNLNVVVLKGTAQQLNAVEALLKKFDVPGQARSGDQQVQLRVHLILASPEAGKDGPVAPEIASAVEQMRKTFNYASYRQLDTLLVQTKNDATAQLSGVLPLDGKEANLYDLVLDNVAVIGETQAVSIRDFRLTLVLPGSSRTSIRTNITVQKGQKVVVGKLSGEQGKGAIFLVLVADIQ